MNCRLAASPIHGMGVFATKDIAADEEIDYFSLINEEGRFPGFNHSCLSSNIRNTEEQRYNHKLYETWTKLGEYITTDDCKCYVIVASRSISEGEELMHNYGKKPDNCKCGCHPYR